MMMSRFLALFLITTSALFMPPQIAAQIPDAKALHPLEIHMKHWIAGSGQWRSPNPDYNPEAEPKTPGWIKEFGVNWKWAPNRHHMIGEIVAITAEGEVFSSSIMYAFYNPVTEKVIDVQVGRNGTLAFGEDRVRDQSTPYGEPEVGSGLEYFPDGTISILRHSNVFVDENTQLSDVFQRDENGEWEKKRQWRWTRLPN